MRRTSNILRAGLASVGLALVSTMALAQGGGGRGRGGPPPVINPDQPGSPQNMAPQRPMMPAAGAPAEMVLRQREHLQLTDDQVKRLEALGKSQRDALKPDRANMLRARADLIEAEGKDNVGQQRSALEKMAKMRIDRTMAMRQAMKETRDILTPDQRDLLPKRPMRRMAGMGGRGRGRGGMAAMMQQGRGGAPLRRPPVNPPTP